MSDSEMVWRGLSVRYNLRVGQDYALVFPDESREGRPGILTIRGLPTTIEDCYFERDESLEPGSILIEAHRARVQRVGAAGIFDWEREGAA